MDFSCYQKHTPDFEPKNCAKYFKRYGLDVEITSDFSDDILIIQISSKTNDSHYFTFRSYKMDQSQRKETLRIFPNYDTALRNLNAKAELAPKGAFEITTALILLSYLQEQHGAVVINDYNRQLLDQDEIAKLRDNSLVERSLKQRFNLKKFIQKYHIIKILISIALIIAYLIFDSQVYYGTTIYLFVIILGLIILWMN